MLEQAADVEAGGVTDEGIIVLGVVEDVGAVLPQGRVDVHAGAVVPEQRFGHESGDHIVLAGDVFNDVLVPHDLVGHAQQGIVLHVDLALAGGGDLVVVDLDGNADFYHLQDHLAADVLEGVMRWYREVAFLEAGLVAQVGVLLAAAVPLALDGVNVVVGAVLRLVEADVVEDEELQLGAPVGGVGDAGGAQVLLRLLGDVARVAAVGLLGEGVEDVAGNGEGGYGAGGIDAGGGGIRNEDHVRFLDLLEAADA